MTTDEQILETSQELFQIKGFNSVSFQDIANAVGIKKASIHYYFPSKAALGKAVIQRYRQHLQNLMKSLDNAPPDKYWETLDHYTSPFVSAAETLEKVCLCGVFGGEFMSLPDDMKEQVQLFFEEHQAWLNSFFTKGKEAGVFTFKQDTNEMAALWFSTLEGAIFATRIIQDKKHIERVLTTLKAMLH